MRHVALLGTVLAMLVAPAVTEAQTATGQITGSVKDSSGAVMEKVKVVVTNEETGLTRETTTTADGAYVVPLLPVGSYVVTAEQSGFKIAITSGVRLNVDQIQRIDLQLDAGNVSETVEVRSARRRPRHGEREHRPQHHREAGDRAAAQRPELPAAALPRGRRGRNRRRAGRPCDKASATPSASWVPGRPRTTTCSTGHPTRTRRWARRRRFFRWMRSRSSRSRRRPTRRSTASAPTRSTSSARPEPTSCTGRCSGSCATTGSTPGILRPRDGADTEARSESVRVRRRRPGLRAGSTMDATRPSSWSTTRARGIERGSSGVLHRADSGPARRPVHDDDHRSADRPAVPEQHDSAVTFFAPGAAGAARNNWYPAPNAISPHGNYRLVRTLPQNQDQFTLRGDQDLGQLGHAFSARYTKTDLRRTAPVRDLSRSSATAFRAGHHQLAGLRIRCPSATISSTSSGSDASTRARDQHGSPARRPTWTSSSLTGMFTDAARRSSASARASASTSGTPGAGRRGQRVHREQSADVGPEQHDHLDSSGSHTLNFGFNYRRWWLQRDLATGFSAISPSTSASPATAGRADMLLGYYSGVGVFQPAAFSVPGAAGNPREFNFQYFAPYFQDDWRVNSTADREPGPAVGLP